MNTTIYDCKSVLALRKILINDFYCDCVIRKWGKNDVQLIYMDSGNLVVLIKTDDFYEHVEGDVEEIYCKSNYHERKRKRQLQAGKNKKLIGLIKHQEVGKIDTKLAALSTKAHAYIVQKCDHKIKNSEFKKVIGVKSQHLKC